MKDNSSEERRGGMAGFADRFVWVCKHYLPSPFVLAILLTAVTFLLALVLTDRNPDLEGPHFLQIFDHWHHGIWELLAFAMQMMLMLVLGHVLALTRFFGLVVEASLGAVKDGASAALVVTLVAVLVSLLNWGLGLILGAILARKVGEYASRKLIPINYPLIGAAGYSGLMVWHGGFSGSAPLKIAEANHDFVAFTDGQAVLYDQTIGSPMNLGVSAALILLLPAAVYLLARRSPVAVPELEQGAEAVADEVPEAKAEQLDYSPWLSRGFGAILVFMGVYALFLKSGEFDLSQINPNLINLLLFGLGLMMHRHLRAFMQAVETAIGGSVGIMIQFPLYAGIMGIMKYSGLIDVFSNWFVEHSNEVTFPLLTLLSAGLVNFFVPSGGGQWAVQGGIVLKAAKALGVPQGKAVMALAYGDQLTNMMQPFWALPLLGITGLKAAQILPYTLYMMMVGLVIFALGLLAF